MATSTLTQRKYFKTIGVVSLALAIGVWSYTHFANSKLPFDQASWLHGEHAEFSTGTPRLRMVDGLIESQVLLRRTKNEVIAMLGPPTTTDYFKDFDLVYWLGAERSFVSIDSEWLVVRLDTLDRVKEVKVVTD